MENNTMTWTWNAYVVRLGEEYPEIQKEEFQSTEGWYEKMALLLQEKYDMSHEEAMEKTKEIAEEVNYDENAVNDDKVRSFHLDSNPDHTGKMTDVL